MMYLADIIIAILAIYILVVLIIVGVDYDKAKKWNDIYKKKGRDD